MVGPTGIPSAQFINGLAFGGPGGPLYLATNATTGFLHQVNQTTGVATPIGGGGLIGANGIADLAWDPVGNRMLAIQGDAVQPPAAGSSRLYSIDLTTGNATDLGTIGNLNEGFGISLAVRSDGTIFAHGLVTDSWHSIDRNTLVATPLGPLGVDTNFGQGADFDNNDVLYHAMLSVTGGNQSRLATIDQVTGAPTFVGPLGAALTQIGDIAFVPVPEPTSMALVGLAASAWIVRRRSKRSATVA